MASQWIVGFVLLSLPLLAGVGLIFFMMSGKGDSATTEEILEHRRKRRKMEEIHPEPID